MITEQRENRYSIFRGVFVSFTFLPALIIFLEGKAVNYTSYGLPKFLLVLFLVFLLIYKPFRFARIGKNFLLPAVFLILYLWLNAVGFYSLSLFFGIGSWITWQSQAQEKPDAKETLALLFLLFLILAPLVSNILIQFFRDLSLVLVDQLLHISQITFTRKAALYQLPPLEIEIWERCSGYSSARIFMIMFGFLFLMQRKYLKMLLTAPILAITCGISGNVIRIYTHLLISIKRGTSLPSYVHEGIGILIFMVIAVVTIYFIRPSSHLFAFPKRELPVAGNVSKRDKYIQISLVFIFLFMGLTLLPGRMEKEIHHRYWVTPNRYFQIEHHNAFVEYAGAGTWILFENPVQYCYQYRGWEKTRTKNLYVKDHDVVSISTVYRIGGKEFTHRFFAVLYKILLIHRWKEPVRAEIVITVHSLSNWGCFR